VFSLVSGDIKRVRSRDFVTVAKCGSYDAGARTHGTEMGQVWLDLFGVEEEELAAGGHEGLGVGGCGLAFGTGEGGEEGGHVGEG